MFGHDDNNQAVMGSPTVQNPSMLDNVSSSDFNAGDDGSTQASTAPDPVATTPMQDMMAANMMSSPSVADPVLSTDTTVEETAAPVEHQLTTDNPFVDEAAQTVTADDNVAPQFTTDPVSTDTNEPTADMQAPDPIATNDSSAVSPSSPVEPPIVQPSADDDQDAQEAEQTNYVDAIAGSDDTHPPVDHDKLADMKREALDHLEPLVDHVGGTPEETFKTTMMMIQANDNHTLLEKALASAKLIEDDKTRAQAMLDIVNEINYFSQNNSAE